MGLSLWSAIRLKDTQWLASSNTRFSFCEVGGGENLFTEMAEISALSVTGRQ